MAAGLVLAVFVLSSCVSRPDTIREKAVFNGDWKFQAGDSSAYSSVGYSDAGYFTRRFKQKTGMTPREWRASVSAE